MAELQWQREEAIGVDTSNMREIMAERSSLQDTVAHMREELDRKEEEVGEDTFRAQTKGGDELRALTCQHESCHALDKLYVMRITLCLFLMVIKISCTL